MALLKPNIFMGTILGKKSTISVLTEFFYKVYQITPLMNMNKRMHGLRIVTITVQTQKKKIIRGSNLTLKFESN